MIGNRHSDRQRLLLLGLLQFATQRLLHFRLFLSGVRGAGCGMRDAGCGVRGSGCGVRGAGCGRRGSGGSEKKLSVVSWQTAEGREVVVGFQLSVGRQRRAERRKLRTESRKSGGESSRFSVFSCQLSETSTLRVRLSVSHAHLFRPSI